jgi:hypothetical protein
MENNNKITKYYHGFYADMNKKMHKIDQTYSSAMGGILIAINQISNDNPKFIDDIESLPYKVYTELNAILEKLYVECDQELEQLRYEIDNVEH